MKGLIKFFFCLVLCTTTTETVAFQYVFKDISALDTDWDVEKEIELDEEGKEKEKRGTRKKTESGNIVIYKLAISSDPVSTSLLSCSQKRRSLPSPRFYKLFSQYLFYS